MFLQKVETRSEREFSRSHVLMSATLITASGAVAVRIRDVSVAGAQLWATCAIPADCDVLLKRADFCAAARVVRSGSEGVGLRFYRRLSDGEYAGAFQRKPAMATALA